MNTIYKVFEKAGCLKNLLQEPRYIELLNKVFKEEVSLEYFENTEAYKDIAYLSNYKDSKWVELAANNTWTNDYQPSIPEEDIKRYAPHAYEIKKAIETRDLEALSKALRNCYLCEHIEFEYEIPKLLLPHLIDKQYINAILKDKAYIQDSISLILDIQSKNPGFSKFISVGWFDEPYMSQDTDGLLKLLNDSLSMCDVLIAEENKGKFKFLDEHTEFHIPLASGQSDSWDEWVHVIPNTIEYACGFSLEEKMKKYAYRNKNRESNDDE